MEYPESGGRMLEEGSIYAFINFKQALQFGHVGWGFQTGEDEFYFGSSDHLWRHHYLDMLAWLKYMHVDPGGNVDWWAGRGSKSEMLKDMKSGRHIHYHAYKIITVQSPDPIAAINKADALADNGWDLYRHNCVHQAYSVFNSYRTMQTLPDPYADPLNIMPKTWFSRIKSPAHAL